MPSRLGSLNFLGICARGVGEIQKVLYLCQKSLRPQSAAAWNIMANLLETLKLPQAESTVIDRLRYLMELARKTQAQFSRLVDVDPSTMSKILSERMPVSDSFINRVVVNLGVSKEWLLNGHGTPFAKGEGVKDISAETVTIRPMPKGAPVYDIDATAGVMPLGRQFTEDKIIGYLDIPGLDPRNPVIRVTGDSMQPAIPDGSLIAIRPINDPSIILWGSTYLIQLEDYRLVKVVKPCREDPAKVILHSENPAYDDMEVPRTAIVRLFLVETVINCRYLA